MNIHDTWQSPAFNTPVRVSMGAMGTRARRREKEKGPLCPGREGMGRARKTLHPQHQLTPRAKESIQSKTNIYS